MKKTTQKIRKTPSGIFRVISMEDQPDGSAIMTYQMDRKTCDWMCWRGLHLVAAEKKLKVLTMTEAKRLKVKPALKLEMTDPLMHDLINRAILDALKHGVLAAKKELEKIDNPSKPA